MLNSYHVQWWVVAIFVPHSAVCINSIYSADAPEKWHDSAENNEGECGKNVYCDNCN